MDPSNISLDVNIYVVSNDITCFCLSPESGSLEERDRLTQQSHLYAMTELAWHLCEVIFIEVLPPGCLVQQLLEWVCWHSGTSVWRLLAVQYFNLILCGELVQISLIRTCAPSIVDSICAK